MRPSASTDRGSAHSVTGGRQSLSKDVVSALDSVQRGSSKQNAAKGWSNKEDPFSTASVAARHGSLGGTEDVSMHSQHNASSNFDNVRSFSNVVGGGGGGGVSAAHQGLSESMSQKRSRGEADDQPAAGANEQTPMIPSAALQTSMATPALRGVDRRDLPDTPSEPLELSDMHTPPQQQR